MLYFIGLQHDLACALALPPHIRSRACVMGLRPNRGCGLEARSFWGSEI
jgi:hypothetical protein